MTGPAQPIEWYLARDNKQYGPLSDVELMKLVELHHLRDQDLVWRAGFTDWTPAPVAFPQAFVPPSEPPRPAVPQSQAAADTPARAPVQSPVQASAHAPAPQAPAPATGDPVDAPAQVARQPSHAPVAQPTPATAPAAGSATARSQPSQDQRAAQAPHPAAKIETLSEYRARLGARLDATATGATAQGVAAHEAPAAFQGGQSGGQAGAALRPLPEADQATAGQERGRAATRRMWIAPADPEPAGPAAPEHQLRIDPTLLGAPQSQPQQSQPQPGFGGGFGALGPADATAFGDSSRRAPSFSAQPHPSPTEQPGQRWPEPQQRLGPGPALDARPAPRPAPAPAPVAAEYEDEELDEEPPRRPRRIWGLMAILTLLAMMVGGTWVAFMHPQLLRQPLRALGLSATGNGTVEQGRPSSSASRQQAAATAKPAAAAVLQNFPDSAGGIDEVLQKGRLWNIVRETFPEWYDERVREAARMVAEKKADDAVTKHLVDSLIALRRKNADHAFQASLPALEHVARSFRDSLELLTKHSHVACYSLISNGEGTRGMIALLRDPAYSPTLQTGLAAVFQAVADGRNTPRTNLPARRTDYDVLTKELQSLGWKEQDINLFSDSEALAKTQPEQVCRMVREWFTAHLAIEDNEIRQRLLIESIRPVVAG